MNVFLKRFISLLTGLFLFALGIVITMKANLGFAPWDVFHYGLGKTFDMSIGNVSILIGLLILVIVVLLGEKIGLGTVLNMILVGIFTDFLLSFNFVAPIKGFVLGLIIIFIGFFCMSFGSYFYIKAGFGAGPRDSLMVALQRKTKLSVGLCRGIIEVSAVLIGWVLGGPVGFGTVLAAFGISFCIQIVFSLMRFEATSVKHDTFDLTKINRSRLN